MRREARAVLLVLLGATVLRLTVATEQYLRYVRAGLRPYLVITGVALLVLGLAGAAGALRRRLSGEPDPAEDDHDGHGHGPGASRTAWLLTLPVLAVTLLAPQALGSYTAQRSDSVATRPADGFDPLPPADPVVLRLADFDARAAWDTSRTLAGRQVRLVGFATRGKPDGWYLARLTISCCAADALTSKVAVEGAAAPPEGSWVEVTGVWQPDTDPGSIVPTLAATRVTAVPEPKDPYE